LKGDLPFWISGTIIASALMTTYESLEVWKNSMELVREVYRLTKDYPREELYSLTSQTRRSAISVPTNIAEGVGRNYRKDSVQFFHISRGSLYELETLLNIAVSLEIISASTFEEFSKKINECIRRLNGLINYFEKTASKK
jgi:four helix bundle protein